MFRNTFCPDEYLCFLAGKSYSMLLRGWLQDSGYPSCYDLPLFATARHYLHYSYYSLFRTIRCSLFVTVPYSLFGFSRHPPPRGIGLDIQNARSLLQLRIRNCLHFSCVHISLWEFLRCTDLDLAAWSNRVTMILCYNSMEMYNTVQ